MAISFHLRQATPADVAACVAIERGIFLPSEAATPEQIVSRITLFPQGLNLAGVYILSTRRQRLS
jgi:hypothetical protein